MIDTPIVISRSWRKTISLHILSDLRIHVKAPYWVRRQVIDEFVLKHTDWIKKTQHIKKNHTTVKGRQFMPGDSILFLGIPRKILLSSVPEIKMHPAELHIPDILQFRINKEIETWYTKQARHIIRDRVQMYGKTMNVQHISISFSDTRSKWGSCTYDNKLQFNWRIILAPIEVVDYLVVHELAHIREKNHSRKFWETVRRAYPGYREWNRWLKKHGDSLTLYHLMRE